jgi:CRISPR type III-B/RAMP module RAMP protein Cmr6
MKTWLPDDTRRALRKDFTLEPKRCESRSLLLNRMPISADHTENSADARRTSVKRSLQKKEADVFLKSFVWLDQLRPASRRHHFTLYTDQRLLLGLANGIHENGGIDLHRFFGVPVITGSKLKGIAADAAQAPLQHGRLTAADIEAIFGVEEDDSQKKDAWAGCVDFLPAYPAKAECLLELDVLTVHYQAYYAGKATDWDSDNPVPSVFPAVAEGQPFNFDLICRSTRVNENEAARLLNLAAECLKHALLHRGGGAKTRAGYGRFRVESERQCPPPAADELFNPVPQPAARPVPSPTPLAAAQPSGPSGSGGALEAFIAQWSGEALVPENIKKFAEQLRTLHATEDRIKAFDACVPHARRNAADLLWQAFHSRHHGRKLLNELDLS